MHIVDGIPTGTPLVGGDPILHLLDLYEALGINWGTDPFPIIAEMRVQAAFAKARIPELERLLKTPDWIGVDESGYTTTDLDDFCEYENVLPGQISQPEWASRTVPTPWIAHGLLPTDDTEARMFDTYQEAEVWLAQLRRDRAALAE